MQQWHPPYAIISKARSLSRTASIRRIAFRPTVGNADKSGESGNVEKRFDPLHGSSSAARTFGSGGGLLQ
jgi:hypothetical protein